MITSSIVVFRNKLEDIHKVLTALSNSVVEKIYLVDNSPTNCFEDVHYMFPKVVSVFNNINIGYGAAHNIAIKKSIEQGAKYHLVVNTDVHFEKGVLEELAAFMDHHPDVGLVMPKILYPNGDIQYLCKLLPTPSDLIFRRFFSFISRTKKKKEKYELRTMDYKREHFGVPSLSGCFMLFRTAVLEKIAGFDERYFLYMEDVDLCRRLHRVSQTAFYPAVSIVHHYAKGSYKNYRLLQYHICAAVKYFNKWGWFFDKERRMINKRALKAVLK
jgi:GT2 family glycosyltransferase